VGGTRSSGVTCAFVQGVLDPRCAASADRSDRWHTAAGGEACWSFIRQRVARARGPVGAPLHSRKQPTAMGYVLDGWVNDVGYQSVGVPDRGRLHEALTRSGTISGRRRMTGDPAGSRTVSRQRFHARYYHRLRPGRGANVQRTRPRRQRGRSTHTTGSVCDRDAMVQTEYARTLERWRAMEPDAVSFAVRSRTRLRPTSRRMAGSSRKKHLALTTVM